MADCMLRKPLHLVNRFCWIGMPHKFRVQVTRMIWRLERPSEIIHRKNILQELRTLEISDAAGLPGRIELVSHSIRPRVEIVIVFGLVDTDSPENDGGLIPVAPDHAANIVNRDFLPGFVADVLPSGYIFENQKPNLIAGI